MPPEPLTDIEQHIVELRNQRPAPTLEDIGRLLGIPRERVRYIENRGRAKLRARALVLGPDSTREDMIAYLKAKPPLYTESLEVEGMHLSFPNPDLVETDEDAADS